MTDYIEKILMDFDYPEDSIIALTNAHKTIIKNEKANELLKDCIDAYTKSFNCDYDELFKKCDCISEITAVHPFTVKLLMYICLLEDAKRYYKEKGYSDKLFYDTMLDLKYKLIECKLIKKIDGNFVHPWMTGFFDLTRFSFGRLQFEMRKSEHYYSDNSRSVNIGDPVINVHIPRTGTPLSPEGCTLAFREAAEFFKDEFKNSPVTFVCHSWLLDPKIKEFLRDGSNIKAFADRFTVVNTDYCPEGDYSEIWRLYDEDFSGSLDILPEDSSLRRNMKHYLKNGGRWAEGYGIFFYDR